MSTTPPRSQTPSFSVTPSPATPTTSFSLTPSPATPTTADTVPDGYLATSATWVEFVQFTQIGTLVSGYFLAVSQTNDTPPKTSKQQVGFSGTHNGTVITLNVSLYSSPLIGSLDGNVLTLAVPQNDGTILKIQYAGASLQSYNQAVNDLQNQVNQLDQQYSDEQATATTQQQEQQAVSDANDALSDMMQRLSRDTQDLNAFSETSTMSSYASHWQQIQNDSAKEQSDAKNGCGRSNSNYFIVQSDAYTVDSDSYSIQSDDYTLSSDKNTYESDISLTQDRLKSVQVDWQTLSNAVQQNTTGTPAPAFTQSAIDAALNKAENTLTTAQKTWKSAQSRAAQYDQETSDLQKKADALPEGMHCL